MSNFWETIKKFWYIIVIIVVLTTSLSFGLSVFQTPEYRSTVKMLVIQKQSAGLDAYTAARSAETISNTLSKVIYTSSFQDQVLETDFNIVDNFGDDPEDRRKAWEKAIDTSTAEESGSLVINVYRPERSQAEQLAYAIAYVLINEGQLYHGGDASIEIKLIDAPITTLKPARPNIPQNTLAGFGLGLVAAAGLMFLLERPLSRRGLALNEEEIEQQMRSIEEQTMPALSAEEERLRQADQEGVITGHIEPEDIVPEVKMQTEAGQTSQPSPRPPREEVLFTLPRELEKPAAAPRPEPEEISKPAPPVPPAMADELVIPPPAKSNQPTRQPKPAPKPKPQPQQPEPQPQPEPTYEPEPEPAQPEPEMPEEIIVGADEEEAPAGLPTPEEIEPEKPVKPRRGLKDLLAGARRDRKTTKESNLGKAKSQKQTRMYEEDSVDQWMKTGKFKKDR